MRRFVFKNLTVICLILTVLVGGWGIGRDRVAGGRANPSGPWMGQTSSASPAGRVGYWLLLAAPATATIAFGYCWYRAPSLGRGHCPVCGRDMTKAPDACPDCGWTPL